MPQNKEVHKEYKRVYETTAGKGSQGVHRLR